jgi:hypothetical protein
VTEAEWLACVDPTHLMQWERIAATERKVRLFAVACCRRIPALNSHETLAAAIDTGERFADRLATEEELHEANLRAEGIADSAGETADDYESAEGITGNTVREWQIQCAGRSAYWASLSGDESWTGIDHVLSMAADAVALAAVNDHLVAVSDYDYDQVAKGAGEERAVQADLFRDVFGNPFRPVDFSTSWRTDTAVSVARQVYESRDFSAMPILADALQDAGCDNEDILGHCRAEGPHVRGCWVVDLVLDKTNPALQPTGPVQADSPGEGSVAGPATEPSVRRSGDERTGRSTSSMGNHSAVIFTRSFPPVSEADVRRYEQRLGVTFPEDYRNFLLTTNGGIPAPRYFDVPNQDYYLWVNFLYAIRNQHALSDLVYELEDLSSRMDGKLPDGFIVIGDDPGDRKFLLGTRGKHAGQVWFWDTSRLMKTSSPSKNTYRLADSFTDFLNGFHERPEDLRHAEPGAAPDPARDVGSGSS